MRIASTILGSCLLALVLCAGALSDDKPPDKNSELAEKTLVSLAAAINARDSTAIGKLFTPTGEFIDGDGNVFQGRDAIAGEFAALFEVNPRTSMTLAANDIREISPGILSVDGAAGISLSEASEPEDVEFTALVVKQADGSWLLASIRSLGEERLDSPHARLKQLAWMIGEWVDESEESTMHTTSRWSDDGHFIVTNFSVSVAGRNVMTGTQRIGWDGSLDAFKSWVFDSEGGFAEGTWTELDGLWIVKSTGVRPDGATCSATQTYEPGGADSYVFSVTDRIIDGESQDDFTAKVVRKPPEPETPPATVPRRK